MKLSIRSAQWYKESTNLLINKVNHKLLYPAGMTPQDRTAEVLMKPFSVVEKPLYSLEKWDKLKKEFKFECAMTFWHWTPIGRGGVQNSSRNLC